MSEKRDTVSIIQITSSITSKDHIAVMGLGDDGMIYNWDAHLKVWHLYS